MRSSPTQNHETLPWGFVPQTSATWLLNRQQAVTSALAKLHVSNSLWIQTSTDPNQHRSKPAQIQTSTDSNQHCLWNTSHIPDLPIHIQVWPPFTVLWAVTKSAAELCSMGPLRRMCFPRMPRKLSSWWATMPYAVIAQILLTKLLKELTKLTLCVGKETGASCCRHLINIHPRFFSTSTPLLYIATKAQTSSPWRHAVPVSRYSCVQVDMFVRKLATATFA